MADLVKRARDCANGIGDFKSDKGDFGLLDDLAARIEALERQIAAADKLADAAAKCIRIMENRQPDKMPDGVYIARTALAAYEATKEPPDETA